MAESSKFWTTSDVGDGPTAGYDRSVIADWVLGIFGRSQGVLRGVLNELAVSGATSPLAVNTGLAIVDGLMYKNSASLNLTVTTPSGGTTGGRVVLRASWAAQTVRAVVVLNTDGVAAIPALTQTSGTTYEISLATFTITTGGAITLTDTRSYATFADSPRVAALALLAGLSVIGRASNSTGASNAITAGSDNYVLRRSGTAIAFGQLAAAGLADNAVGNTNLRQSAGLSAVGRAANSTGDVADITAATDGRVLLRSGTALAFGQIVEGALPSNMASTAKFADDAVDDTKLGDRALAVTRRQGGSATAWSSAGTTDYTPGAVMMQCGAFTATIPNGYAWVGGTVTFGAAFSSGAVVTASPVTDSTEFVDCSTYLFLDQGDAFAYRIRRTGTSGALAVTVHWLAVGPR